MKKIKVPEDVVLPIELVHSRGKALMCAVIEAAVEDHKMPVVEIKETYTASKKSKVRASNKLKVSAKQFLASRLFDNLVENYEIDINVSKAREVLNIEKYNYPKMTS